MASGYTICACRDCMDTAVSEDENKPELCTECENAGCDVGGDSDCERDDAYRLMDEIEKATGHGRC